MPTNSTMTPAAIRAAEGPALDAFVLERVCGLTRDANGWRDADRRWWHGDWCDVSVNAAACWRWVVPALIEKGWGVDVCSPSAGEGYWRVGVVQGRRFFVGTAPTPALAIVRAAALTVAEGGE